MSESQSATIDVAGLLTIDVASELRKLSQAQLQGPWQIPAELVRSSIRRGAGEIRVDVERHRVVIRDDGERIAADALQATAIVLDTQRSNDDRHAALTLLERTGELALLAVAGLPPRTLNVTSVGAGTRWKLEWSHGRVPWLEFERGIAGRTTEIEVAAREFDRRQIVAWLENVGRFASVRVSVCGRSIVRGFADAIATADLAPPLRGRICISFDGDTANAFLLEHGLVSGHIAIPEAPAFEAAVELADEQPDLNASRLRDVIAPQIPQLVDQAASVVFATGRRADQLPESVRQRLARLVLQCAHKGIRPEDAMTVPVFRVIDDRGARRIDLASLQSAALGERGQVDALPALYPSQKPDRFAIGSTPVLIADATERSRLAEVLHLRFRPPDPRDSSSSVVAAARRAGDRLAAIAMRTGEWIRHPLRPARVPDDRLDASEVEFLRAIRPQLGGLEVGGVHMCHGAGPIRRSRHGRLELLLPRRNRAVLACVAAVAHDPAWIYPAMLTLLQGKAVPSAATRQPWLRRIANDRDA